MNQLISELVTYGMNCGLIDTADKVYTVNRLLELFELTAFEWVDTDARAIHEILSDMVDYAVKTGILKEDTITNRDLFDTKIMGILTPMPSVVRNKFDALYAQSPKTATDFYYKFSKDTNYIRADRIAKDEKWQAQTDYGLVDITINLSKPEKDPKDIANAAKQAKSDYP
nr:galactose-1-phosphate uridylyltransferase [Lachnospiraceae bacterium]